ncbi:MAG: multidrug transporter [Gemmatimonadaceae bacterium]|nr:multidrug transporter [Gemmatimonadaceae bacterium]
MHTGKRYRLLEVLIWTKRETLFLTAVAILPTILSVGMGFDWLQVPWVPVAMLGTASAFTVGFRNNATYGRTWEARQIWGSIVNASRAWGIMARDFVPSGPSLSDDDAAQFRRTLVHRHVAWLTALRYQLREPRVWENMDRADNREFRARYFTVSEMDGQLPTELQRLMGDHDAAAVQTAANRATAILAMQSATLQTLAARGVLDSVQHVALVTKVAELLEHQGRCERIKNFPYPRQFATLNYWFIRLFVWLVPFGMLQEFRKLDSAAIWLTIPFSVIVTWIFLALEKVGESTENPFEGSANDVPITALSRTIEIDLRQILGETDIPKPLTAVNSILM